MDMARKGRAAFGDRNGTRLHPEAVSQGSSHWSKLRPELIARGDARWGTKLTEESVRQIRTALASGTSQAELARRFGVSNETVRLAGNGTTWSHIK